MALKLPSIAKDINPQGQEAEWTPHRLKKPMPGHIITLLKTKEKVLKAREKHHLIDNLHNSEFFIRNQRPERSCAAFFRP